MLKVDAPVLYFPSFIWEKSILAGMGCFFIYILLKGSFYSVEVYPLLEHEQE